MAASNIVTSQPMPHDGALPVNFVVQTPGDEDDLNARMALNDARGLVEAVTPRTCIIVGSGPSAASPALWERIRKEKPTTVACNGAYQLFAEQDLTPTYWTCCDPQDETLDFLPAKPNPKINYLLATKCPEALFDHLISNDCFVRTWRLDDMRKVPGATHIPCAVSITLVTQNLMRFMGFHRFEMYGWDCCYLDGKHHASTQPEPLQPIDFSIQDEAGNELHAFKITGSWAAELKDACIMAHNNMAMGYETVVHGQGAVAHLLHLKGLATCPDVEALLGRAEA